MDAAALLDCAFARWQPGIGDPSPMGWATVAAYALAALLALAAARAPQPRPERAFWIGAAVFLALLAVNKQLDLQSFVTAVGRCVAQAQGWYDERRAVQREVIGALIAGTLLMGAVLAWALRRTLAQTWLAWLGLVAITAFVLTRAVGFHHMDELIKFRLGGARMNWVLELGGIALVAAGALWAMWRRPRHWRRVRGLPPRGRLR